MKYYIWHNTRGIADEYFVVRKKDDIVLFGIPKILGRLIYKIKGKQK